MAILHAVVSAVQTVQDECEDTGKMRYQYNNKPPCEMQIAKAIE